MTIDVSICIPTYNRAKYLSETLSNLINQQVNNKFEILVLDNACDHAVSRIVDQYTQVSPVLLRYIAVPKIGLHHSRHSGARNADGEILIYIDDDVITPPGWLDAMIAPFKYPEIACVGGKTIPKWEIEPPKWISLFGMNGGGYLSLLDLGDTPRPLIWPEVVYGCNMAVRKKIVEQVGGFNPDAFGDRRFIWYRGDGETGFQKKIVDAGYQIYYQPSAWLFHQVPRARLHPKYFYWRAFIQGISDSFTITRANHPAGIIHFWNSISFLLSALYAITNSLRKPDQKELFISHAYYRFGQAQHQLRLCISGKLRRYVYKSDYF